MVPEWLFLFSIVSLILAAISAAVIIADLIKHPQPMAIMNWVWPITALYFGLFALWMYFKIGRQSGAAHHHDHASEESREHSNISWQTILKAATHCGAGCTLGDIIGEWLVVTLGLTIAGSALWPEYVLDFALAYLLGILSNIFRSCP